MEYHRDGGRMRQQPFKRAEWHLTGVLRPTTDAATSARMGRVRQRDTDPEIRIRRFVTAMGFRYRTSNKDLPGSPDLANRAKKWALFVHGCFWHHHLGCSAATVPKSNRDFWEAKFLANRDRDARVRTELETKGFTVMTIWECQSQDPSYIRKVFARMSPDRGTAIADVQHGRRPAHRRAVRRRPR